MIKRILITLILVVSTAAVYAQQYTAKNLIGQWQETRRKQTNIVFNTDSTGMWLGADGFLYNKMTYSAKVNKDIIELKYTTQINRKNPSYFRPYIKFLNDSIFLIRLGWAIPKDADTTNKKVAVFKRIKKDFLVSNMRYPNYSDILGAWTSKLKDTTKFQRFTFVDTSTVYIQTSSQGMNKLKYIVDFKQQPITMDIYNGNILIKQCFLEFYNKDSMRLEFFEKDKRGDHFTVFGGNAHLYRDKKVDPALYHQ
jgi:hypothetical protein